MIRSRRLRLLPSSLGLLLLLPACMRPPVLDLPAAPPAPGAPVAGATAGTPEQPLRVSIEEAVFLALRHNRDLQVREYAPIIAGTFELIERGEFDTELFAELERYHERASEVSRSTGERFSVEGDDTLATVGVRRRLVSGTDVELGTEYTHSDSSRTPEQQALRLGLTVTQSLLRGFGPAVNLAGVRQAEAIARASCYELQGFVQSLLAETKIAYWNLVLAEEGIRIVERSLEVARSQRDAIEEQIEVGALPETQAAAARSEVAIREQALIDARSLVIERKLRLLRFVSPPPNGRLDRDVQTTSLPQIDAEPIENPADHVLLALRSRPEIKEARMRLEARRFETVATRNGILPRLDVFITLGRTGYAESFSGALSGMGHNTYDAAAGIRFSKILGNHAAEGRNVAAWAARYQAVEAISNLQQLVRFDVLLALNEVERARQQITASRVTRELRAATAEAERERYRVGSSTTLLVAQAQRDELESEIDEVRTVVRYRIALVNLYLAEGTLVVRSGIDVCDAYR